MSDKEMLRQVEQKVKARPKSPPKKVLKKHEKKYAELRKSLESVYSELLSSKNYVSAVASDEVHQEED